MIMKFRVTALKFMRWIFGMVFFSEGGIVEVNLLTKLNAAFFHYIQSRTKKSS